MSLIKKFQQGGTVGEPLDFFVGRLTGQLTGGIPEIANEYDGQEFTIKSSSEYWDIDEVKQMYDEDHDKFMEDYKQTAQQLQLLESNDFDAFRMRERTVRGGMGDLFEGVKERKHYFDQTIEYQTSSGAEQMFGEWTVAERDKREISATSGLWFDDEGNEHYLGENDDDVDSFNDMIREENYTNKEGKEIIGFAYDPRTITDPYYRGKQGMQAVYSGQYKDFVGHEWLSFWDATGWYSDWDLEPDWYDFIPRTANNFFFGFVGMLGALGAGVSGLFGAEDAREWFEDGTLGFAKMMQIGQSEESKETGAFGSMDNFLGMVGDVALQLGSGKAVGSLAMGASRKVSGRAAKGLYSAFDQKAAKYASSATMSLYAGKDMYDQALANGFTPRETGALYFTNLAGMFAVHRTFNWMDDAFKANQVIKNNSNFINNNIGYSMQAMKAAKESGDDVAAGNILKRFYEGTKRQATNIVKKGGDSYPGAMINEAFEEMGEMLSEETVKHAGNFYSWIATGKRGEAGDHRFKDMWDEGYWEEFGMGMLESAAGGMLGGAIGKRFFHGSSQTQETKDRLIDIIAAGDGDQFLQQLDDMHAQGVLGPKDRSIEWDVETETYKKMDQVDEGVMNMNDANKQLLLQEYNYIKTLVDKFGGTDAAREMLDKIHTDLGENDDVTAHLSRDIRNKTKEYIDLVSKNDAEEEEVQEHNDDMSEAEKKKHYEAEGRKNGIDPSVAQRIGELKKEIDDINSGKAAEKYFLQALAKDSVFDPESKINEEYKEYGEFFLADMMDASNENAERRQEIAEERKQVIKDNSEIVENLEDDLSNIDEVEAIFGEEGFGFLSDKAKQTLAKKAENHKLAKEEVEALREEIKTKLLADGKYDMSTIYNSEEFKAIREANPEKAKKAAALAEAYYKSKIERQLKEAKTSQDFYGLEIEQPGNLVEMINALLTEDMSLMVEMKGSNILDIIEALSTDETRKLGEKLSVITDTHSDYKYIAQNSITDVIQTDAAPALETYLEHYFRLANVAAAAMKSPSEKALEYDPTNVSFLAQGFSEQNGKIVDEGDLRVSSEDIIKEYNASAIMGPGTEIYNDLEGAKSVLRQIRARRTQLELLAGLDGTTFEPKDIGYVAELRARNARIFSKPNAKSSDIINEAIKEQEKAPHRKFFNDTAILDLVEFSRLHKKGEKNLNGKEKQLYNEQQAIIGQIQLLLNGNKEMEIKGLKDYEAKLEEIVGVAEKNQNPDNVIANQKNIMIAKLNEDIEMVSHFIKLSDFDKVEDETVKAAVAEFEAWYASNEGISTDDESIADAFNRTQTLKKIFRSLEPEQRKNILTAYWDVASENGQKDRLAKPKLIAATIALEFNEDEFWSHYKGILESGQLGGIPLVAQEEVALAVAAHMNSDVASMVQEFVELSEGELKKLNGDVMFVSGLQGTGKSTFTLGVGLQIGLAIQAKKYGKENTKVLLASNSREQVDIIKKTAEDFGIISQMKEIGAEVGVNSTETEDGVRPQELIELLRGDARDGKSNLRNVSTIVFDEATYVQYNAEKDSTSYDNKSDLGKMIQLVREINTKRTGDQPKLRLVLTGDPKQNGHVNEQGEARNVGTYTNSVFTPTPLKDNMRSQITSRNQFTSELLKFHATYTLGDMASEWGYIQNEFGGERLGGIRFNQEGDDFFNDQALADNIKLQIEDSIESTTGDKFTVGIIHSDFTEGGVDPDSEIGRLMEAYPDHFTEATHETVQGREFDYVIAIATKEDIGKTGSTPLEIANAKKLSTTIGRARYFTAVMNLSGRNFNSEQSENITLPPQKFTDEAVSQVRATKIAMIPESITVEFDAVSRASEETKAIQEEAVTNNQKAAQEVEEEKETLKRINDYDEAYTGLEKDLRELVSETTNRVADNIKNIEARLVYLEKEAKKKNENETLRATSLSNARKVLVDSDNIAARSAARMALEFGAPFTQDEVDLMAINIEEVNLTVDEAKIVEEETVRQDSMDAAEQVNENTEDVAEETEDELKEIQTDALNDLIDRAEKLDGDLSELIKRQKELLLKAENGEDVVDEIKKVKNQILILEGQALLQAHQAELDEKAELLRQSLDSTFGQDDAESATGKDVDDDVAVMEKMEEEGFVAAYSDNGGRNGNSSQYWDRFYLPRLGGEGVAPESDSEYIELQLAAMGLKTNKGLNNFSYELRAYKTNTGFTKIAIVATETKTGKRVIVGGLNQVKKLQGNGKKIVAQVEEMLADQTFSETIPDKNGVITRWKKGIPISDPYNTLRMDLTAPGAITRSESGQRLSDWKQANSHVNVSDTIFISTDTSSPYKGEAFLLYSYNDAYDFSTANVDELLKDGIVPVSPKTDIFKGYQGGVGIIRLDNAPLPLQVLDKMIADIYSPEAMKLTKHVNKDERQKSLVSAFGQILYTIASKQDGTENLSPRLRKFLDNQREELQFNATTLAEHLDHHSKAKPEVYDAMVNILSRLFNNANLGKPALVEGEPKIIESKGRVQSETGSNVINILVGSEYGVENDTATFALHKFVNAVREEIDLVKADISSTDVMTMMQELLSVSKTYSRGLYLNPGIVRDKADTNTIFAGIDEMPGMKSAFYIKVDDFKTPTLRLPIDQISGLLENANSVIEENEVKLAKAEEARALTEGMQTVLNSVNEPVATQFTSVVGADNAKSLKTAYTEARKEMKAWEEVIKTIPDFNERAKAEKLLKKRRAELDKLNGKRKKEIRKGDKGGTIEGNVQKLAKTAKSIVANTDTIESEKAAVREKIKKGELVMPTSSKLTEDQWVYTQTPSFKSWAGQWGNNIDPDEVKVLVDSDTKEPRVFYHGSTNVDISEFDSTLSQHGFDRDQLGSWFAATEEEAWSYRVLPFTDPVIFREEYGNAMSEEELDYMYNNVNNYIGVAMLPDGRSKFEGTDQDWEVAKNFVEANSKMYEVFIKGDTHTVDGEGGQIDNAYRTNEEAILASGSDVTVFENVIDSVIDVPSTIVAVKDKVNVRIVDAQDVVAVQPVETDSEYLTKFKQDIADITNKFVQLAPFIYSSEDLDAFKMDIEEAIMSTEAQLATVIDEGSVNLKAVESLVANLKSTLHKLDITVGLDPEQVRKKVEESMKQEIPFDKIPKISVKNNTLSNLMIQYHTAKATSESTKIIEKRISNEINNRTTHEHVEAKLISFLNDFGVEVNNLSELGLDNSMQGVDILNKVANIKDKKDLTNATAKFLSYFVKYNPTSHKIYEILDKSIYSKDVSLFTKNSEGKIIPRTNLVEKPGRKELSEMRRELLESILVKKLSAKVLKDNSIDDGSLFEEYITTTGEKFNSKELEELNKFTNSIINKVLNFDEDFIRTTQMEGFELLNFDKALKEEKLSRDVFENLAQNPALSISGSLALAAQGTVYRKTGNLLHDLDFKSTMTPEENEAYLKSKYPSAQKIVTIENPSHITNTYVVLPEGYTLSDLKLKIEYLYEDPNDSKFVTGEKVTGISSYKVLDSKGKVVGEQYIEMEYNDPENIMEGKSPVYKQKGIQPVLVDFFTEQRPYETVEHTFINAQGESQTINLVKDSSIFEAKLEYSRLKDIYDYNRYFKYEQEKLSKNLDLQKPNTAIIAEKIYANHMPKVVKPTDVLADLVETPVSDLDTFKSTVTQIRDMQKAGDITKSEMDKALKAITEEFTYVKEVAAMVAEGKVDVEKLNEIKDSNVKTLLLDSLDETFSPEAQKIINSTWGGLKKFLPSDVANELVPDADDVDSAEMGNAAALERTTSDFEAAMKKAEEQFNAVSQFILNEDKKSMVTEQFETIKNHAVMNVESHKQVHAEKVASVEDIYEATTDNLVPVSVKETLTPDAISGVENLDSTNQAVWIKAVNGEDVKPNELVGMFKALTQSVDPEAMKNIQAYYRDRVSNRNKICKS